MKKKPRLNDAVRNVQSKDEERKNDELRFTDAKRKQKETKNHTVGGF